MSYCSILLQQREIENHINAKSIGNIPAKKYLPDDRATTLRFTQAPDVSGSRKTVVRV